MEIVFGSVTISAAELLIAFHHWLGPPDVLFNLWCAPRLSVVQSCWWELKPLAVLSDKCDASRANEEEHTQRSLNTWSSSQQCVKSAFVRFQKQRCFHVSYMIGNPHIPLQGVETSSKIGSTFPWAFFGSLLFKVGRCKNVTLVQ